MTELTNILGKSYENVKKSKEKLRKNLRNAKKGLEKLTYANLMTILRILWL